MTAPKSAAVTRVSHWVDGAAWEGTSERSGEVFDPATGAVTKLVAFATGADVGRVVEVAASAVANWSASSLSERARVLFRFRQLLSERAGALAEIITSEHGKVLSDARGEVARGLEVVDFACGIPHLLKGSFSEGVASGLDVYSLHQAVGVCAIVSPFNFPAMVPCWFFPLAIAAGNSVILKPSEKDPSASNWLGALWAEAGLPAGVFNVVHGDQETVGHLLDHPHVKTVSFVGSTPVARVVYERAALAGKRVQALGGAKNHMVVLPDADIDLAADAAVNAGFGSAGERCMAISVVVAVGDVGDALVDKIVDRIGKLRVGDGRRDVDMGPLVTADHRDRVAGYVGNGETEGATLVVDGRPVDVDGDPQGFWLGPTLFDHVTEEMSLYTDEIFGPVLCVVRAPSYADALDLVNRNPYGNGTAIFTNDGGAARRFQSAVEVGMVGVNVSIPVPVASYSFGGWKQSLFGDTHAYGPDGVHFFTRTKVVTSRWLDPSHGGLNLGFPQHG
jgi:malonate-semialdehyde dehydrogenase (acetylating) / methylmalonate-semialdehyde dehydrogenase